MAILEEDEQRKYFIARIIKMIDWVLFGVMVILIIIGIAGVYSATARFGNPGLYYAKQMLALVFGACFFLVFVFLNYQIFRQYASVLYGMSIIMLIAVLIWGETIRGSRSWFDFQLFSFQPVEITKVICILVLASYLDRYWHQIRLFKGTLIPMLIVFLHTGFILLQPDFSSSLVYFPVVLGMLFLAGARVKHLASYITLGATMIIIPLLDTYLIVQPKLLAASPFLSFLEKAMRGGLPSLIVLSSICGIILMGWWFLCRLRFFIPLIYPLVLIGLIIGGSLGSVVIQKGLKEYQRKRLVVFLNPDIDPLGAGYNITQSEIAVGSGRFLGRGYLSGTQSRLGFLPEQHTDFIFSVIGEEFGFFFSTMVILLFLVVCWRAFAIARLSRDRYGSLVAGGIGCMFAFYAVMNIGMVMGIMPVTGLPLPFLSYGGSCMVSSIMAIGILSSIHIRRYIH